MALIAPEHIGQSLQCHKHRRLGIDAHRALNIAYGLLVECFVARNHAGTVYHYINIATRRNRLLICSLHSLGIRHIHLVATHPAQSRKLCDCSSNILLVDIPYYQLSSTFLQSHTTHNAPYAGRSARNQNGISYYLHISLFYTCPICGLKFRGQR